MTVSSCRFCVISQLDIRSGRRHLLLQHELSSYVVEVKCCAAIVLALSERRRHLRWSVLNT